MPLAIFDLDNTLVDRTAAFVRWASALCPSEDALTRVIELDAEHRFDKPSFFATVAPVLGTSPAEVESAFRSLVTFMRLDDGTSDALIRLRCAGWRIGIATNGSPWQVDKIVRLGLADLVDGWAVSQVDGCHKPQPRIFAIVAKRCGGGLDGAWMTGDDPGADIGGGQALGLRTIWMHRGRRWPCGQPSPTAVAASVSDAVDIMLGAT